MIYETHTTPAIAGRTLPSINPNSATSIVGRRRVSWEVPVVAIESTSRSKQQISDYSTPVVIEQKCHSASADRGH